MTKFADNDPEKWKYDLHTRIKHEILMRYINPWTTILGQSASSLAYVDGFAGRGRYGQMEPGSPLLTIASMVNAMNARRIRATSVSCHFIEQDSLNCANLKQELALFAPAKDPRIAYKVYCSPFSTTYQQIIAELRRRRQPAFFFLDPFGYDDIPMHVFDELLSLPKAEVLINLMYDFATRAVSMSNPSLQQILDSLFGTTAWRSIAALSGDAREIAFAGLYCDQLKQHGARYVLPFRMGDDDRDRTLYYLVHASRHILGAKVMKDSMVKAATPGQFGYAGERLHRLTPLFDFDVASLGDVLTTRFAGKTLSFDDIVEQTFDSTGTCREPDYRACLKALEVSKQISVCRISSKTVRGLKEEDQIKFL